MSGKPRVFLAQPRSFCAGVVRAIDMVEAAIERYGAPIYVRHAIVHNQDVVAELTSKGAIFVEELIKVPTGSRVILSAHGVSPEVYREADQYGLKVIDAICPLVLKVHNEVKRFAKAGYTIVLIGHRTHVEVVGTFGEAPDSIFVIETVADVEQLNPNIERIAYVTQTTLSVDDTAAIIVALEARFPHIVAPAKEDICYATTNRQHAVKEMAERVSTILVVSSPTSSNGTRLVEVACDAGCRAYMVERPDQIDPMWIIGDVGITAAASTPESTVQACVQYIQKLGGHSVEQLPGIQEITTFVLPPELRQARPKQVEEN